MSVGIQVGRSITARLMNAIRVATPSSSPGTMTKAAPVQSPLQVYATLTSVKKIRFDQQQYEVMEKLDDLLSTLLATEKEDNSISARFGLGVGGDVTYPFVKGYYIFGGVGVGKSFMMDTFHDCVEKHGLKTKRIHFHEFILMVHSRAHELGPIGQPMTKIARQIARETRVLCFDEFQVTDIADACIVKQLFEELFQCGVVVVATSNRAPDSLYEGGLNRHLFVPFIDFLKDNCNIINVPSENDYRTQVVPTRATFFSPLNLSTAARLQDVFTALSKGETSFPKELSVDFGRSIKIDKATVGVAFCEFDELCKRPLSAADYQSIAKEFHTVILNNVPQFEDAYNEARRFITLVDVLYEHGTTLICGCEVPLDQLCVSKASTVDSVQDLWVSPEGGSSSSGSTTMIGNMEWSATGRIGATLSDQNQDVSFAFSRTKSRLAEMSGELYGFNRRNSSST